MIRKREVEEKGHAGNKGKLVEKENRKTPKSPKKLEEKLKKLK